MGSSTIYTYIKEHLLPPNVQKIGIHVLPNLAASESVEGDQASFERDVDGERSHRCGAFGFEVKFEFAPGEVVELKRVDVDERVAAAIDVGGTTSGIGRGDVGIVGGFFQVVREDRRAVVFLVEDVERRPDVLNGGGVVFIAEVHAAKRVEDDEIDRTVRFGLFHMAFDFHHASRGEVERQVFGNVPEVFVWLAPAKFGHHFKANVKIVLGVLLGEVDDAHGTGRFEEVNGFGVLVDFVCIPDRFTFGQIPSKVEEEP